MTKADFVARATEDLARRENAAECIRYQLRPLSHGCNHRSITKRMQRDKRKFYK